MDTMRAAYDEVYAYTMGRPGFLLQHVVDALAAQTANGPERDMAIDDWCRSVWTAFAGSRQTIVVLLREYQVT